MSVIGNTSLLRFWYKLKALFVRELTTEGPNIIVTMNDGTKHAIVIKNTVPSIVSRTSNGLMTPDLKKKLDNMRAGSTSVDLTTQVSSGTLIGTLNINGQDYKLYCNSFDGTYITFSEGGQGAWSGNPAWDDATGSVLTQTAGIGEGTYTLKDVLQRLVTLSHSHDSQTITSTYDSY